MLLVRFVPADNDDNVSITAHSPGDWCLWRDGSIHASIRMGHDPTLFQDDF